MCRFLALRSFIEFQIALALILFGNVLPTNLSCRLSEFLCRNGRCIPSTHFCDNIDDCGDSSDEPRLCSPCNTTYYGDLGRTYELELHRPREEKLPFICHLILTANGASYGDFVQVTFDSFTMGRFQSFTTDGCPDGFMQITESNRPQMGGQWCGTATGPIIYYSETNSIVITVRLMTFAKDQTGYNFDFRINFKMIQEQLAVTRLGDATSYFNRVDNDTATTLYKLPEPTSSSQLHFLGDLIPNTYCSRIYNDCSGRVCRLQSPNFPGVYPRNLTCYYAVRQHQVPAGQYAMITIKQDKNGLFAVRSSPQLYVRSQQQQAIKTTRVLKVWEECDQVQDYIIIYDGYTTRDPVLLKFCGSGEPIPVVMSSGPELLVEFTSSPFGTFLYPGSVPNFHGFQLEVEVKFVDKESTAYIRNKKCELTIRGSDKGVLESPRHSLPPNTTCTYHLEGMDLLRPTYRPTPGRYPIQYDPTYWARKQTGLSGASATPRYRVWLSVLKFHVNHAADAGEQCKTQLQIWDGMSVASCINDRFCNEKESSNFTLLAKYCKDHVPRSCEHSLLGNNDDRFPRPCTLTESFLTSSNSMTLQLTIHDSTALKPVSFKALYEFVDLHQDGEPFGVGPCSRRFISRTTGAGPTFAQKLQSPRDVFLFGRGGNTNLSCIYRFEGQKGERLKLTIQQLETGGRPCRSFVHEDTGRAHCYGVRTASLQIMEFPFEDTPPFLKHCLCSSQGIVPFSFTSTGHIVELRFLLHLMNATDDFRTLNFVGSWEFMRHTICKRDQRIAGISSGQLSFSTSSHSADDVNCEYHPWAIEPTFGKYLYTKVRGVAVLPLRVNYVDVIGNATIVVADTTMISCETRNRFIVQTGDMKQVVICPEPPSAQKDDVVEFFSDGWEEPQQGLTEFMEREFREKQIRARSILVEFLPREAGFYSLMWLELTRRKPILPPEGVIIKDCVHWCPELDACINSSLWCDGISHCPSGYDESLRHCYEIFQLPALYLVFGVIGIICLLSALCIVIVQFCRRRRKRQARLIRNSDSSLFGEKQVIC